MRIQTKQHLIDTLQAHHAILRSLGVARCGIFGSFVHNHVNDTSDVDVLVEFLPQQKTFDNFMNLAFLLEDILGRPVDIVTREGLSRHIGPHILDEVEYVTISA